MLCYFHVQCVNKNCNYVKLINERAPLVDDKNVNMEL